MQESHRVKKFDDSLIGKSIAWASPSADPSGATFFVVTSIDVGNMKIQSDAGGAYEWWDGCLDADHTGFFYRDDPNDYLAANGGTAPEYEGDRKIGSLPVDGAGNIIIQETTPHYGSLFMNSCGELFAIHDDKLFQLNGTAWDEVKRVEGL